MSRQLTIVAFGAHPDDLEGAVFGTLAKYKELGHRVHIVIVTDGRRGNQRGEKQMSYGDFAAVRKEEAKAAAAHINVEPIFLDFEDGRLIQDHSTYEVFINLIKKIDPDIIFTHDLSDYHPDHRTTGKLVIDTSGPVPVFFMDTAMGVGFQPQFYVDTTAQHQLKLKALKEHVSQQGELMAEYAEIHSRFRGAQCVEAGLKHAEVFSLYPRAKCVRAYRLLPE